MEVDISKITVTYPSDTLIQWDVTPDDGVSGDYVFEVERSGSPEGPWTLLTTLFNTIFFSDCYTDVLDSSEDEEDESINALALDREIYYRVKATDPAGTVAYSQPVNLDGLKTPTYSEGIVGIGAKVTDDQQREPTPLHGIVTRPKKNTRLRLLRRKILRDQYITFRQLNGTEVKVLKRRHFGTNCTSCKDTLTRELVAYKCTTCYGTGWTGGFYTPITAYALIQPVGTQKDVSEVGNTSLRRTSIRMLSYPKVEEGDVIVETYSNRRWLIQNVEHTEVHRLVVHQELVANELSRDSVEYLKSV